jgi:hypothetical protein
MKLILGCRAVRLVVTASIPNAIFRRGDRACANASAHPKLARLGFRVTRLPAPDLATQEGDLRCTPGWLPGSDRRVDR